MRQPKCGRAASRKKRSSFVWRWGLHVKWSSHGLNISTKAGQAKLTDVYCRAEWREHMRVALKWYVSSLSLLSSLDIGFCPFLKSLTPVIRLARDYLWCCNITTIFIKPDDNHTNTTTRWPPWLVRLTLIWCPFCRRHWPNCKSKQSTIDHLYLEYYPTHNNSFIIPTKKHNARWDFPHIHTCIYTP